MTHTLTTELLSVARAMRDYIDALPADVVASLPTMPGFDRDWADEVMDGANREAQPVGFYTTVSGRKGVVWHNGAPEDDTAIYTAPPAPVVNSELTGAPAVPEEKAITPFFDTIALDTAKMVMCDLNRRTAFLGGDIQLLSRIQCRIDNACRAAMLAQPVSQRYKLPEGFKLMPLEITDEIAEAIAMEARCCGGIALCIYEAALAAAPEGGN